MSTATGYYRAGTSWLHRRNPITKLLAVAPGPAGDVPPAAAASCRSSRRSSSLAAVVDRSRPGHRPGAAHPGRCSSARSSSSTRCSSRAPPTVSSASGRSRSPVRGSASVSISAGRLVVAFLVLVTFLFTTLADDLLESLVARGASHRIAFVVLSAVQMVPRMQDRAGSILDAQQARGLAVTRLVPPAGPGARPARRPGPARLAHRRPRADVRARGARLRGAAGAERLPGRRRPADRSLAPRCAILLGIVGVRRPRRHRRARPVTVGDRGRDRGRRRRRACGPI